MEGEQRFVLILIDDRVIRMDTASGESWTLQKLSTKDYWEPITEASEEPDNDDRSFAQFIREQIKRSHELDAIDRVKWLDLLDEWQKEYRA